MYLRNPSVKGLKFKRITHKTLFRGKFFFTDFRFAVHGGTMYIHWANLTQTQNVVHLVVNFANSCSCFVQDCDRFLAN